MCDGRRVGDLQVLDRRATLRHRLGDHAGRVVDDALFVRRHGLRRGVGREGHGIVGVVRQVGAVGEVWNVVRRVEVRRRRIHRGRELGMVFRVELAAGQRLDLGCDRLPDLDGGA